MKKNAWIWLIALLTAAMFLPAMADSGCDLANYDGAGCISHSTVYSKYDSLSHTVTIYHHFADGTQGVYQSYTAKHRMDPYSIWWIRRPDCTESGLQGGYCRDCGESIQQTVPKTGHVEVYAEDCIEPSCDHEGYEGRIVCANCGIWLTRGHSIPKIAHTPSRIQPTSGDCQTPAMGPGSQCAVCGEILKQPEPKGYGEHVPADMEAVESTCAVPGHTGGVACELCGEVLTQPDPLPLKEHTPESLLEISATCTQTGLSVGSRCTVCGEVLTEQKELPKLPHIEETIPAVASTCTAAGLTEGVKCSVCGEIIKAQEAAPLADHTPETMSAVAATCTAAGLTEGSKCAVCGEILLAQEETALADHTPETMPAVAATCTAAGLTEGSKCAVCGEILLAQEETALADHTPETVPAVAATCLSTGLTEGTKCAVCGEILLAQEETALADHTPETVPAVEATCNSTGLTEGTKCAICGETLLAQEETPVVDHLVEVIPAVAPTCTAPGATEGSKCAFCGEIYMAPEEIPTIDHTMVHEFIDSTCTENGVDHDVCTVCGYEENAVVIPTAHTLMDFGSFRHCVVCGITASEKDSAQRHLLSTWQPADDTDVHTAHCMLEGCSYELSVPCTVYPLMDENILTLCAHCLGISVEELKELASIECCPICGRFGERTEKVDYYLAGEGDQVPFAVSAQVENPVEGIRMMLMASAFKGDQVVKENVIVELGADVPDAVVVIHSDESGVQSIVPYVMADGKVSFRYDRPGLYLVLTETAE